jgi:hypothetical protein
MIIYNDLALCQDWVTNNYDVCGSELSAAIAYCKEDEIICVVGYNNYQGKSCHIHAYHKGGYIPREYLFIPIYPTWR